MLRTALCTAVMVVFALTTQAQDGRKPAVSGGKAVDTAGKATIPVGPVLAGEEKLSAQERAERTFLMPPRKKMPSVQPVAPQPQPDAASGAVAIGPPTEAEVLAEEAAKAEAAKPAATAHRSTSRRHYSSRHRSSSSASRKSSSHRSSSKKKTSSKKKSSRRR
ncbi:hypothetical protein EJV47_13455 [Hymenobacter gummosus]|uniref:Uncharacterized protein n=1 Tax=Hymenobacter gummosus TaxID=1776032 RepID=A0A3S0H8Q5_9BACT|nr:hypothetical protein [Hymenobacter gummosus]RTQ49149.1 hypothetical protein EJV47_13455 [Hymenobacter gummosus]